MSGAKAADQFLSTAPVATTKPALDGMHRTTIAGRGAFTSHPPRLFLHGFPWRAMVPRTLSAAPLRPSPKHLSRTTGPVHCGLGRGAERKRTDNERKGYRH